MKLACKIHRHFGGSIRMDNMEIRTLPEVLAGILIAPIAHVKAANRQATKTNMDKTVETPPDSPVEIRIAR